MNRRLSDLSRRTATGWLTLLAIVLAATPGLAQAGLGEELRVGTWVDEEKQFLSLSGEPAPGFERELLEGFARLHRVELRIVPLDTIEDIIVAVEKGTVDAMAGGFVASAGRRERLDFATGVFPTRHVVMTRKPSQPVTTLELLTRERVGTVAETSWAETLAGSGVPSGQVHSYPDRLHLLDAFRSGQVTAVVMSVETAMVEQRSDPQIELGLFLGKSEVIAWGVNKDNRVLRHALDDYVTNVRRSGAWNRLIVKYWGADALEILKKAQSE